MGKTLMQLEWAANVPGRSLILAPLGVVAQTKREAESFGYGDLIADGRIVVTNYEKLHLVDPAKFDAVVLDESSILKNHTGRTRQAIIDAFGAHKYKLACTATPSPNDFMELGNHSEFVGAMPRSEMLAMYFVHDGGSTQNWRLKGHARGAFWRWVASWASMVRRPSDMGYDDEGFDLPPLRVHHRVVGSGSYGALVPGVATMDLHARRRARRDSIACRVASAAAVDDGDGKTLFWCDLNDESSAMAAAVPDAVEVTGADTDEHKGDSFVGFGNGDVRALVTKPRMGGFGLNWQACNRMVFVGLSDSYEAFYQATRRCWRFGQTRPVDVHLVYSEAERPVIANVLSKESSHVELQEQMLCAMKNR